MGGPLNKSALLSLGGLFVPIPAIPGPVCVICLDEEP